MLSHTKILIVLLSTFSCASTKNIQQEPPIELGEVYFERWNAGVKGGGYGYNVFIPVKENKVQLDSIYFRDKSAKLTNDKSPNLYIGRFKVDTQVNEDFIMSSDPNEEANNQIKVPEKETIPFTLEPNQCIVSYIKNGKTQYFKIENVVEKPSVNYPSVKPN